MTSYSFTAAICCFNSAERIHIPLSSLLNQTYLRHSPLKILIIDNNSRDDLLGAVNTFFESKSHPNLSFELVLEPNPGLANARKKALEEINSEYVVFVDDDNYLFPDYIDNAHSILLSKNNTPFLNGSSFLPKTYCFDLVPPYLNIFSKALAIGYQRSDSYAELYGYQFLWGAGLVANVELLKKIILKHEVRFALSGRVGSNLSSGEDGEICYLMIACSNYRPIYSNCLKLNHYIDPKRWKISYFLRLWKAMGVAFIILTVYKYLLPSKKSSSKVHPSGSIPNSGSTNESFSSRLFKSKIKPKDKFISITLYLVGICFFSYGCIQALFNLSILRKVRRNIVVVNSIIDSHEHGQSKS